MDSIITHVLDYGKLAYCIWVGIGGFVGFGVGVRYGWRNATAQLQSNQVYLNKPSTLANSIRQMYWAIFTGIQFTSRVLTNGLQSMAVGAIMAATFPASLYIFDWAFNQLYSDDMKWTVADLTQYIQSAGAAYPFYMLSQAGKISTLGDSVSFDKDSSKIMGDIGELAMSVQTFKRSEAEFYDYMNKKSEYELYKKDKEAYLAKLRADFAASQQQSSTITLMLDGGQLILRNPTTTPVLVPSLTPTSMPVSAPKTD